MNHSDFSTMYSKPIEYNHVNPVDRAYVAS